MNNAPSKLRASVAIITDPILYTGQPTILGVCLAPVGNRSPRLWWVIWGNSTHLKMQYFKQLRLFMFDYLYHGIYSLLHLLLIAAEKIEIFVLLKFLYY